MSGLILNRFDEILTLDLKVSITLLGMGRDE
jgi:hypothetical protein